jgi:hypothetical protein
MASTESFNSPAQRQFVTQGWEAALRALHNQALDLEARGANRAAVTLYDAIRIVRARGLTCEQEQLQS